MTASLQKGKTLPDDECPGYDIKASDGEAPALEIWEIRYTPSLPLLLGPFLTRVKAPERILSVDQIEQIVRKQMTDVTVI